MSSFDRAGVERRIPGISVGELEHDDERVRPVLDEHTLQSRSMDQVRE